MHSSLSISVAMATFNGEKYLHDQLISIASQNVAPTEIIVCDDGSSDRTVDILKEFKAKSPITVKIFQNRERLGFGDNFLKAASMCQGDLISFSDQDDVWLPDKLADASRVFNELSGTNLVLQNSYLCDDNLCSLGQIFPNYLQAGHYGARRQFGFWVWPGFLQTFRSSLLEGIDIGRRPRSYYPNHDLIPHDKLICLLANTIGGIHVLSKPSVAYRRHGATVTSRYDRQSNLARIKKALPIGSEHYDFLAEIAAETSDFLCRIADHRSDEIAIHFRESARAFIRISAVYRSRSALYSSRSALERFFHLSSILFRQGYFSSPILSLGWRSAAKDLLRATGFLSSRPERGKL